MVERGPALMLEFVDFQSAIPATRSRSEVLELRIDYGPGYRVYFVRRGEALVILVAGGDKRTQSHDISTAIKLARNV
jgi:putative addiction module killer protein